MALLKRINDKGAVIAWSPLRERPALLALGTKEGGGGGFDDYGGELSLHSMDLTASTTNCDLITSVKTRTRFSSLTWGLNNSSLTSGLLVGGMADGVVSIWDANGLLEGSGELAQVAHIERHTAPVRSVQFNPNASVPHLLAAASSDGDISIIDLQSPSSPTIASPLTAGQRLDHEVTSVAWNTSVTHILATATMGGVVVVWDLRENRPWCTLKDPHRSSVSEICWHPEDGLYLVTACDDDSRPVLRLWDLRSSTTTPLAEFIGHTKGVLSVDWNPHDPNLLVSSGKDSHTYIWDVQMGRAIGEIPVPSGNNPTSSPTNPSANPMGMNRPMNTGPSSTADIFNSPANSANSIFGGPAPFGSNNLMSGSDAASSVFGNTLGGVGRRYCMRWSKRIPALLAGCSFDRKITVHNTQAIGPSLIPQLPSGYGAGAEATFRRGPKWLRRPVGASFGFGGKLVVFGTPIEVQSNNLRRGTAVYPKKVQICGVHTDMELSTRASNFEQAINAVENGQMDPRTLCTTKATTAESLGDTQRVAEWNVMRMLFEPDTRNHILAYLGYDSASVTAQVNVYVRKEDLPFPPPVTETMNDTATSVIEPVSTIDQSQQMIPSMDGYNNNTMDPNNYYNQNPSQTGMDPSYGNNNYYGMDNGMMYDPHSNGNIIDTQQGWGGGATSAQDFFGAAPPMNTMEPVNPSATAGDIFGAPPMHNGDMNNNVALSPHTDNMTNGTNPENGSVNPLFDGSSTDGFGSPLPHTTTAQEEVSSTVTNTAPTETLDPEAEYVKKRVPNAKDDEILRRALLVGDFPSAVAVCFRQDRLDDALLLATASGSPELFTATQEKYLQRRSSSPLKPIMSSILKNELSTLVATSNIQQWRDTLAALCTYAKVEEFIPLCEALGDRLVTGVPEENIAADIHAAILVYMCARATNKVINIWINQIFNSSQRLLAVEDLVQKSIVLRRAVYQSTGTDSTLEGQPEAVYIAEYVSSLAEDGQLPCAASYAIRISATIRDLDPTNGTCGDVLRDRLLRSFSRNDFAYPSALAIQNSPFPYTIQQINPAPVTQADTSFMNSTYPSADTMPDYSNMNNQMAMHGTTNYNQTYGGHPMQQPLPSQQPTQQQSTQIPHQPSHGYGNVNPSYNQPSQSVPPTNPTYRSNVPGYPTATSNHVATVPSTNAMPNTTGYNSFGHPAPSTVNPRTSVSAYPPHQPAATVPSQPAQTMGFNPAQAPSVTQTRVQATPTAMQPPVAPQPTARPTAMPNASVHTVTPFGSSSSVNPVARPTTTTTQMFTPTNTMTNNPSIAPNNAFTGFANTNTAPSNPVNVPSPAPAPAPVNLPIMPEVQYVLDTFNNTIASLRTVATNAMETRQLNESTTSVELIKSKYSMGLVNNEVLNKLRSIADAVAAYDFRTAQKLMGEMATMDWNNTKEWQKGVRHIVTLGLIKSQGNR